MKKNLDLIKRINSWGSYLTKVSGRINIDDLDISQKLNFIHNLVHLYQGVSFFRYNIMYWEDNSSMSVFLEEYLPKGEYLIHQTYNGTETPGRILIEQKKLNSNFFRDLLTSHFNYELAEEPALNLRVELEIELTRGRVLLDIYDDRGFNIQYMDLIW